MSSPGEDAEAQAPTLVATTGGTLADRTSRPVMVEDGLEPGMMIGRYRLDRRLGAGAMGVVWRARDPRLDRDVAIKVVHPSLALGSETASRFRREAQAMAKLSHRAVVTVHDTGEVDGRLFITMELVQGKTLGSILRARTPEQLSDWHRWLNLMIEAGQGLAEAHRAGILHRDFKPDNVLVDGTGRVCVGDFGLASMDMAGLRESVPEREGIRGGTASPIDLTTTGALLGTPMYMSPQQLRGEVVDARADQFAFCVATHEALYGSRPFRSVEGLEAIPSLVDAIETGELPEPPRGSSVPAEIRDVLRRGLSVDPAERWPDMDELLAALTRAARRRSPTVMRRQRRRWLSTGMIVAVGAVLLVIAWVTLRRGPRVPHSAPPSPPPQQVAATPLFGMPLRTKMAVTPDASRIAIGGDVLAVYTSEGKLVRRTNVPMHATSIEHMAFDGADLVFSIPPSSGRWRWKYTTGAEPARELADLDGPWRGSTVAGELVYLPHHTIALVGRDGVSQPWGQAEVAAVSPNGQRVAYIDGGRFTGTIAVRDVTHPDRIVRSTELDEPVALAWVDDRTLIYATSTLHEPKMQRATIDADSFGPGVTIRSEEVGWYSDLAYAGGQLFFVSMTPEPSSRMVDLDRVRIRDLSSNTVGIGWDADNRLIAWDPDQHDVSLQDYPQVLSHTTRARLDVEPANATVAGRTLIATLRRSGGRQAVAYSLESGDAGGPRTPLWKHEDKRTLAVRCAGDLAPPCFALRYVGEQRNEVVSLDPSTGALGTDVIYGARRIEDIAVTGDGRTLLVVGPFPIRQVDLATGAVSDLAQVESDGNPPWVGGLTTRSVAASDKAIYVAGTIGRNRYQAGVIDNGRYSALGESNDQILAFVRPSRDLKSLSFVARKYKPLLHRMPLAR